MDITLAIPVIVGVVAAIKAAGLTSRWAPLCSIIIGLLLYYFFTPVFMWENMFEGLIAGLSASGLWSGVKATIK